MLVVDKSQGFQTIGVDTWIDQTFNCDWNHENHDGSKPDYPGYMESAVALMEWCRENNFTYYGAPAEEFRRGGEYRAIAEAVKNGFDGIILEDMS